MKFPELRDDHEEEQSVGIPVDHYKVPTFERRLKEAGFEFTGPDHLMIGVSLITVKTKLVRTLHNVIKQANEEARRNG